MQLTFRVQWRRLWRSLTIYMSVAILIPVTLFLGVRWFRLGYSEAFRHLSPLEMILLTLGIVGGSAGVALGFALLCRRGTVRLGDDFIEGCNYWAFRRRIPLEAISALSTFSSNGINAVVVQSKPHGKIYILEQTENLDELLALLNTYVPGPPVPDPGPAART